MEYRRFRGHLSAWLASCGWAGGWRAMSEAASVPKISATDESKTGGIRSRTPALEAKPNSATAQPTRFLSDAR